MRQRNVTGFTGRYCEAYTNEVRTRRLQAVGFGVKAKRTGFAGAGDPMVQPRYVRHAFISRNVDLWHRRRGGGRAHYRRAFRAVACVHRLGVARNRLVGSGRVRNMPNALQQGIKPVMLQKFGQRFFGYGTQNHVLNRDGQRAIFL